MTFALHTEYNMECGILRRVTVPHRQCPVMLKHSLSTLYALYAQA